MKIWTIWQPIYWLDGFFDLLTGLISVFTAGVVWTVLPKAIELPSTSIQLLQKLFDLMPQLGFTAFSNGHIEFFNEGWHKYTGTTLEEIQGRGWEKWVDPNYLDALRKRWVEAVRSSSSFEMELPILGKDGHFRWFITRANPLFDQKGKLVRWVGVSTDIHEQKQLSATLEQRVAQRTEELQRSNRDLEQFAYVASHDLQEPLRTITSFCELLNNKLSGTLDSDGQKYLDFIVEGTARMQQLVRGLLSWAKIDTKEKVLVPVSTTAPLFQALTALEIAIADSQAKITYDEMPTVLGDETQLSLLFQNLIANAIKFRSNDSPKIHISTAEVGDFWQFTVNDNGIGIQMEYAERIFVIFQRLHSRSKYQGTGIGLAICKRIVERHGGTIEAKSTPGEGSSFIFTLLKCPAHKAV